MGLIINADGTYNYKSNIDRTGKIIKSEIGRKEPIYIVELYGSELRFPESALIHQNPDDERDWKLKQLLK